MVYFNTTAPPQTTTTAVPERPELRVLPLNPVQSIKGDDKGNGQQQRNQRRRNLFSFLMDEVETLPGLEQGQFDRIRDNVRDYVRRELSKAEEQRQAPPPDEAPHEDHAEHAARALAPEPPEDGENQVEETARELAADAALIVNEMKESKRLADQLRACLALKSQTARKISTYIQAMIAAGHENHLVEIDV